MSSTSRPPDSPQSPQSPGHDRRGALLLVRAAVIAEVVVGAFGDGRDLTSLQGPLFLPAGLSPGRAAVAWLTESAAHRGPRLP